MRLSVQKPAFSRAERSRDSDHAASISPPSYGIDFVDRGLPPKLRAGMESLSGIDLSDVRVHANSDKPAQLNAAAYTQGSDIYLGAGNERHLPHEAWHVVQQKQGRVTASLRVDGMALNDDRALEAEADAMGTRAVNGRVGVGHTPRRSRSASPPVIQAKPQKLLNQMFYTDDRDINGVFQFDKRGSEYIDLNSREVYNYLPKNDQYHHVKSGAFFDPETGHYFWRDDTQQGRYIWTGDNVSEYTYNGQSYVLRAPLLVEVEEPLHEYQDENVVSEVKEDTQKNLRDFENDPASLYDKITYLAEEASHGWLDWHHGTKTLLSRWDETDQRLQKGQRVDDGHRLANMLTFQLFDRLLKAYTLTNPAKQGWTFLQKACLDLNFDKPPAEQKRLELTRKDLEEVGRILNEQYGGGSGTKPGQVKVTGKIEKKQRKRGRGKKKKGPGNPN